VKLWPLLQELLDESPDARADAPGVDAVIVMKVLERDFGEEGGHTAQPVVQEPDAMDLVVLTLRKAELHVPALAPQSQPCLGSSVSLENVTEVRAPASGSLRLLLKPIELREPPRDLQVGGALASVAGRMGQREVVLGVETVLNQRVDVVDVELAPVEHQVDRLIANEAAACLPAMEATLQGITLLITHPGEVLGLSHCSALL
jgi:hypothetical protein